ncbi:hypothetical protein D3273_24005 [Lichenibacterium minor]|uniref:Uncharacterized protein n=1 Tax=Lichenibacterium minor TaxID=2316528 RepID=A0A4Q2U3T2_9HYPH|nr:hypothetical protein [Lichenibacterium minor]RYC29415.1 hypothetical protein D3273_24005 [Lichenibacterium minor]
MIKLQPPTDANNLGRSVSEFLARYGEKAIIDTRASDPNGEAFYQQAVDHLSDQYDRFTRLIALTMNDQSAALAHEIVAKLMGNAWMIGTAAVVAPEVKQKMAEQRTESMRRVLKDKKAAAETALMQAIEIELAGRAVLQPKKEADAMLAAVNARLKAFDFAEVKVGVVYLRLKKLVRS